LDGQNYVCDYFFGTGSYNNITCIVLTILIPYMYASHRVASSF
jgi:hypothetical protein